MIMFNLSHRLNPYYLFIILPLITTERTIKKSKAYLSYYVNQFLLNT